MKKKQIQRLVKLAELNEKILKLAISRSTAEIDDKKRQLMETTPDDLVAISLKHAYNQKLLAEINIQSKNLASLAEKLISVSKETKKFMKLQEKFDQRFKTFVLKRESNNLRDLTILKYYEEK
ncbi:MAG: hypothetical protein NZT61_06670 [Deltaproteobacteria bacterium]|nr:hypothetical protein [Deltaproteobacteria bacterium]MCX7953146.1 hypothetical protein [Deltaproteobacteria bacterium]